jgi:hypothetical protein
MPAWRHFDPMPVLAEDRKRNQADVTDDDEEGKSEEDEQERAIQELLDKD